MSNGGNSVTKVKPSEKIIDAAIKLIKRKGYSEVSLRDIANEANVALSQLNYYYKNKEGMFSAVIERITKSNITRIKDVISKGANSKECLQNLLNFLEDTIERTPESLRIIVDLTSMALWSDKFRGLLNSFYDDVASLIEVHVTSKSAVKYSSDDLSKTIFASIYGIAMQSVLNPLQEKVSLDHLNVIVDN